jgi:hypothetical protein
MDPEVAFTSVEWACKNCGYVHGRNSDLPFPNWPREFTKHSTLKAERFWMGFFRIATEHTASYWKQCNTCGKILPFHAFSKHTGWGPLERQMECRSCKGAINAVLNPRRTKEQLHESSVRRRVADLLLKGENQPINHEELFQRFSGKCFKTGKPLDIKKRGTWTVDHILPSLYLYPLTVENAALLSKEANEAKKARWPSDFYTNNQLIDLSKLTGADLNLLASQAPIINRNIDVNACVSRFLKVREHSNLSKRLQELRKLIMDYSLLSQLSSDNKKILGIP